jgi:type IV pilus secretin PilQ/predicted competence protein
MRKIPPSFPALIICIAFLAGCATTGAVGGPPGEKPPDIEIASVSVTAQGAEVVLSREGGVNYTVYKPSDMYTNVIELPGVRRGAIGSIPVEGESVISALTFSDLPAPMHGTHIEVVLREPGTVMPAFSGATLVLNATVEAMDGAGEGVAAARVAPTPAMAETQPAAKETTPMAAAPRPAPLKPATVVSSVEFAASERSLNVTITGDGALSPKVFTWQNKIVVDMPHVKMKAKLPREVMAPVRAIRQGVYEDKVRIVIETETEPEYVATEKGNAVMIAVPIPEGMLPMAAKAPAPAPAPEKKLAPTEKAAPAMEAGAVPPPLPEKAEEAMAEAAPVAKAQAQARPARAAARRPEPAALDIEDEDICDKRVSLDFQNADVVPIFRFLGDVCSFNVVIHPGVGGKINLKLHDVPASQALDIILEMSSLGKSFKPEGRILTIATTDVFTQRKEQEARLKQAQDKVEDLSSFELRLIYISAADFLSIAKDQKAQSSRGSQYVDDITNTIFFKDTRESINELKRLALRFDDPRHGTMQFGTQPQIMIEAKMVEVSKDYSRALGISWTFDATDDNFSFINDESSIGMAFDSSNVGSGFLNIGYTETFQLAMSLSALEEVGQTKSLANPRVITLDRQAATITQGTQIPYSTIEDGTAKVQFQSAALSLNVTPQIMPDGFIQLKVTASNDTPTAVGNEIGINTQNVTTNARVKNGGTLVLGGIYTNIESVTTSNIPYLGKIPFLGWFFKTEKQSSSPKELLIFITPTVLTN